MRRTTLLVVPTLFFGACNVFEGSTDALAESAVELIADGRTALGAGNTQEAMRLFTRAVEVAGDGSYDERVAQLGLASAMLQDKGINVLTLESLANDLDATTSTTTVPYSVPAGAVCSFGAGETVVGQIDLASIDGYQALRANVPTLRDAYALILDALDLPDPATRAQIETAVQGLRSQGADTSLLTGALADGAISSIGLAYDRIVKAGSSDITWVVLDDAGNRYVGYCAPTPTVRTRVEGEAACAMPSIGTSVSMVEVRASFFPAGSVAGEVSTKARDAYTTLGRELSGACAG